MNSKLAGGPIGAGDVPATSAAAAGEWTKTRSNATKIDSGHKLCWRAGRLFLKATSIALAGINSTRADNGKFCACIPAGHRLKPADEDRGNHSSAVCVHEVS